VSLELKPIMPNTGDAWGQTALYGDGETQRINLDEFNTDPGRQTAQ
jgi:hypothetical protein